MGFDLFLQFSEFKTQILAKHNPRPFLNSFLAFIMSHLRSRYLKRETIGRLLFRVFVPSPWHTSTALEGRFNFTLFLIMSLTIWPQFSSLASATPYTMMLDRLAYWSFSTLWTFADSIRDFSVEEAFLSVRFQSLKFDSQWRYYEFRHVTPQSLWKIHLGRVGFSQKLYF